jgi:hypothetical protein
MKLLNSHNRRLLWMEDNELRFRADNWDVEWVASRIIVSSAAKRIAAEIELVPPNEICIRRGEFFWNGRQVLIRQSFVRVPAGDRLFGGQLTAQGGTGISFA